MSQATDYDDIIINCLFWIVREVRTLFCACPLKFDIVAICNDVVVHKMHPT